MNFSTETNNALRVVFELSLKYEENQSFLESIERTLFISNKQLEYILEILKENRIIELYERRKEKVCRLLIMPSEIKVSQIIRIFEPLNQRETNDSKPRYIKEIDSIIYREIWEEFERKIEDIFGNIYFDKLIEKYRNTYSFMLNI